MLSAFIAAIGTDLTLFILICSPVLLTLLLKSLLLLLLLLNRFLLVIDHINCDNVH